MDLFSKNWIFNYIKPSLDSLFDEDKINIINNNKDEENLLDIRDKFLDLIKKYTQVLLDKAGLALMFDEVDAEHMDNDIYKEFEKLKRAWYSIPVKELNSFIKIIDNKLKLVVPKMMDCNKDLNKFYNIYIADYYELAFPDTVLKDLDKIRKFKF